MFNGIDICGVRRLFGSHVVKDWGAFLELLLYEYDRHAAYIDQALDPDAVADMARGCWVEGNPFRAMAQFEASWIQLDAMAGREFDRSDPMPEVHLSCREAEYVDIFRSYLDAVCSGYGACSVIQKAMEVVARYFGAEEDNHTGDVLVLRDRLGALIHHAIYPAARFIYICHIIADPASAGKLKPLRHSSYISRGLPLEEWPPEEQFAHLLTEMAAVGALVKPRVDLSLRCRAS